jgi:hypothetical protein
MKWASNKAIFAEPFSLRQRYYANHSAKRYSRRFQNFGRKIKAERLHLVKQRADADKLGKRLVTSGWTDKLAKHRRTFNKQWQRIEREQAERDVQNKAREAIERETIRAEARAELINILAWK